MSLSEEDLRTPGDLHARTVYRDTEFQVFMDNYVPRWRDLSFEEKRMYAKRWNLGGGYGNRPLTPADIGRILQFPVKDKT